MEFVAHFRRMGNLVAITKLGAIMWRVASVRMMELHPGMVSSFVIAMGL